MNQLDELRRIIVGDNSEQLSELKQRVEDVEARTRDVAEVLAPAIDLEIRESDKLINALRHPVSEGLKKAIRQEPEVYADILYPAISPSIRRAISQAISSMLVTINQTVESATSISGMGMRVESWRSGIPYAQLVLRRSLVYRVEHVYLIERESGMLMAEYASEDDVRMDSDAVSAMFSAIQSFVQDSFSGNEEDRLTDFKVGAHTVWIAHGPRAMLACVILGDAPESLKTQLYDTLDDIRTDYAVEFAAFDGDTSSLDGIEQYLAPVLQLEMKDAAEIKKSQPGGFFTRLVYVLLAGLVAFWVYHNFDRNRKSATAEHYLNETPGMLVTNSYWQDDQLVVEGLRDADAQIPWSLLREHGLEQQRLNFVTKAFESRDPQLEVRRLHRLLHPDSELTLLANENTTVMSGPANLIWLLEQRALLEQLMSENRLTLDDVTISPASVERFIQLNNLADDRSAAERVRTLTEGARWGDIDRRDILWLQGLVL